MTPLDAVRYIWMNGPTLIDGVWCGVCQQQVYPLPGLDALPHMESCPWFAMPQIVAALEAADRYVKAKQAVKERNENMFRPIPCGGFSYSMSPDPDPLYAKEREADEALQAALKGKPA